MRVNIEILVIRCQLSCLNVNHLSINLKVFKFLTGCELVSKKSCTRTEQLFSPFFVCFNVCFTEISSKCENPS